MDWAGLGFSSLQKTFDLGFDSLGSLISGAIDHRYWNKKYDKTRKDFLADRAHQEEYNSPTAQMQRLADAGLNPNLIYGQKGAAATGGSTQAQQQSAPAGGRGSNTASVAMMAAANAQRDQTLAQANRTKAETRLINMQADWYGTQQGKQIEFLNSQIDMINQNIKESESRIDKIAQDIKVGKSAVSKQDSETMLNFYRSYLTETETQLKQKQISTEEALQSQMAAFTALYSEQVWTEIAKRDNISAQTWLIYTQDDYQTLLNEILSANKDYTIEANKEELLYKIADFGSKKGIVSSEAYQWAAALAPLIRDYVASSRDLSGIGVDWYKAMNPSGRKGINLNAGDFMKIASMLKN